MLTIQQQQARIAADKTSSAYLRKTGQTTAKNPVTTTPKVVTPPKVSTPAVVTPQKVATPTPITTPTTSGTIKIGTSDMSPTVATNYLNNVVAKNPNASVIVNGKTMTATQALAYTKSTPAPATPPRPTAETAVLAGKTSTGANVWYPNLTTTKFTAEQLVDKVLLERKDVNNVQTESWWSGSDLVERQKANDRLKQILGSADQLAAYAKAKDIQNIQDYSWWSTNTNKQAAWDIIQKGQAATPGTPTTPTTPDTNKINDWMDIKTPEDMDTFLNDLQLNNWKEKQAAEDTPPTRNIADLSDPKTATDNVEYFSDLLTPKTAEPEALNAESKLTELKAKYKTEDMESQVDDLDAQIADLEAATRMQTVDEEGKPVAMGVISGRITEVQRNAQDKLDTLQRQKNSLVNQLQTKYGVINDIMSAAKLDYDTANEQYQQAFNKNLQVIDLMRGVSNDIKTDQERERSNAQANWSVVAENIANGTIDYSKATDSQKLLYSKLEMQAGLPAGTMANIATKADAGGGWKFNTLLTAPDGTTTAILLTNTSGEYKVQSLAGEYSKFGASGNTASNILSKTERTDQNGNKVLDVVYADNTVKSIVLGPTNTKAIQDPAEKAFYDLRYKIVSQIAQGLIYEEDAARLVRTQYPDMTDEEINTFLGN